MAAVAIVYLGMLFLPLLVAFSSAAGPPSGLGFQTQVTRIYDDRFIFPFRGSHINGPRGRRSHSKKSMEVAGARDPAGSGGGLSPPLRAAQERLPLVRLRGHADPARLGLAASRPGPRSVDLLRPRTALGRVAESGPAASKYEKAPFSHHYRLHGDHFARPSGGVCQTVSDISPGARAFLVADFRVGSRAHLRSP